MNRTDLTADQAARLARVTGLAYLGIAAFAIFANFIVLGGFTAAGDPDAVFAAIREGEQMFRFGLGAFLVMLVLDAVVAFGLYLLLRPAGPALALFAFITHLIYTSMHGAGMIELARIPPLLGSLPGDEAPGAAAAVMAYLRAHSASFMISLTFFGVHLVAAGLLVMRAAWWPSAFGVLLIAAGVGYVVDTFAYLLLADPKPVRAFTETFVIIVALIAELGFALWMLVMGVRRTAWPA
ncbi:MAG: DUF4386 domain-containing protein [Hyphomonadaceae bacterium]